jgi:putative glutamine amidotransferase
MKPRIGITSFTDTAKPRGRYASINANYTRSVADAGGLPFVLPIAPEVGDPSDYLEGLDGLLVSGGGDVSPLLYGEEPGRGLGLVSSERDEFELALVLGARSRGMPIFGICRGHQLVNVAFGGSLWQDLDAQVPGALDHSPPEGQAMDELRHSIAILPGARLLDLPTNGGKVLVNSFHHQAVKELASGLVATARAPDGVLEAFEGDGDSWLLCVQFHPEALTIRHPRFLALFRAHVEAARSYAGA